MASGWIAVRPMDNAALLGPFVFAVKANRITFFQAFDFVGQVDIVRHQKRLPAGQLQDKPLVARTFFVIRQGFDDYAPALDLNVAASGFKSLPQNCSALPCPDLTSAERFSDGLSITLRPCPASCC